MRLVSITLHDPASVQLKPSVQDGITLSLNIECGIEACVVECSFALILLLYRTV